jgi:hypothetical protein
LVEGFDVVHSSEREGDEVAAIGGLLRRFERMDAIVAREWVLLLQYMTARDSLLPVRTALGKPREGGAEEGGAEEEEEEQLQLP